MLVTNGRNEVTIRNTKFVLFFLCIFFISLNSSAQKELQNWYFGTGSDGITFKNGIPEKLNDKYPGIGFEAMIVVNDPVNGDLKFYADGQKVINRNHQVMQNGTGLNGHWSGAQSVQSCPVPGSCSQKFYLFTNSGYDLNPGAISYSIVDFTDNLSGEIKNKNTPLWNGPSDEALCLVNKPNSNDYWLIANRYQTSEYMVWPVTSSGIGTPISYTFSTTGSTYQMNFDKTTKKIVVTGYGNKRVTIIDFNPNSGILSNETQLGPNFGSCFAARFSPDGSKLYASVTPAGSPITTPSVLFQYNFATSVWTDMSGIGACCYAHDIKMGPDGKMYHIHTYYGTQPLAVIEKPNETAINNECNYHNITFSEDFTGEVRRFPEFVTLPSPPTILPDSIVASDVPVIIDVLANDYDYNFSNSTLKIDAIEYGPKFGTAVISQNTIVYTPGSTKCVTDTLIYRARGLDCITDTAYVIIKKPATASYTYIDTTICEGYEYNGHRSSGTYHDTLKNLSGCDSIVVIHLSLSSPSYTHERIEMCEGENYNGHTSTGIYLDTLTTVEGCDSIITTDLLFKTKSYTKLYETDILNRPKRIGEDIFVSTGVNDIC